MLNGSASVFVVRDIKASIAHYKDAFGFELLFVYGEPPSYACFCRDEVNLHLIAADMTGRQAGQGAICIFVDDVDAIHADLVRNGARVLQEPQDYDYGMRDFNVVDLDGNQLTFGMASKTS